MTPLFRLTTAQLDLGASARLDKSARAISPVAPTRATPGAVDTDGNGDLAARILSRRGASVIGRSLIDRSTAPAPTFAGFVGRTSDQAVINVNSVAAAATARSAGFADGETVKAGTFTVRVQGKAYRIALTDGQTLNDVADSIRASGAAVDVRVATDGSKDYLQIENRSTGYSPAGTADQALSLDESYTGTTGSGLNARVVAEARNASITINGQTFERQTNTITDALPHTSIRVDALQNSGGQTFVPGQGVRAGLAASLPQGVYSVAVQQLATAAEAESQAFDSAYSPVHGGKLTLEVGGTRNQLPIAEGSNLADVASQIQNAGVPVSVAIRQDAGQVRLTITNRDTGYPVQGRPEDALRIGEETDDGGGPLLGLKLTRAPENARLTINGVSSESADNGVAGAVPGLTLDLKAATGATETLFGGGLAGRVDDLTDSATQLFRVLQDHLLTSPGAKPPTGAGTTGASDQTAAGRGKQGSNAFVPSAPRAAVEASGAQDSRQTENRRTEPATGKPGRQSGGVRDREGDGEDGGAKAVGGGKMEGSVDVGRGAGKWAGVQNAGGGRSGTGVAKGVATDGDAGIGASTKTQSTKGPAGVDQLEMAFLTEPELQPPALGSKNREMAMASLRRRAARQYKRAQNPTA